MSEIAAICGGSLAGCDRMVTRVVTDSRTFSADGEVLFVAIRTANRDGAAFIGEMYRRGVRGFLVGSDYAHTEDFPEAGFVVVDDTVAALQALAAHHRTGFTGKVVGITGSYGKTIVKEWIAQLAPRGVSLFRSPKSWNSQIGVPLSILMATGTEDYAIIEAGISEPGEMAVLERIIRPDTGILTSVGGAHSENFASSEQLRQEKIMLFRGCPDVLYGDRESGVRERDGAGKNFEQRNAALATAFWEHEGYEIPASAVADLEPVATRLEVKEGLHNSVIINDTYTSDPASMPLALDFLARVAGDRPMVVVMPENPAVRAVVETFGVERLVEIGKDLSVDDFLRSLTSAGLQGRAILVKGGARMGFDAISHALELRSHTTVLEVDLDAVIGNLRLCRSRLAPGVGVMPMIKASGYGHGTFEVARVLQQQGVDYLAVAFADEGVALREGGITMPIVVLNADAGSFEPMIRARLEPEIYNFVSLNEFIALVKRHGERDYPIHIKLDTGMHRLGFSEAGIPELIAALRSAERYVRVATVFSHLAAADDPAHDDFTRRQIALFERMSGAVARALPYPVRRHLANTSGIERFPEAHFDLVRLGLGLYGIGLEGARQAATLKTRIVNISSLEAGETVGYGRCGVLERPSVIATIPTGYADGLSRRLSGGAWSVLVGGEAGHTTAAPIVGNVCMDSCMIDVTDIQDVAVGDPVVIFSPAPGNTIEDMARVLGTIPYEVMTSVSARVKRIYIKE